MGEFTEKKTLSQKISVAIDQETYDLYRRVRHCSRLDIPSKIRESIIDLVRKAKSELDAKSEEKVLDSVG